MGIPYPGYNSVFNRGLVWPITLSRWGGFCFHARRRKKWTSLVDISQPSCLGANGCVVRQEGMGRKDRLGPYYVSLGRRR